MEDQMGEPITPPPWGTPMAQMDTWIGQQMDDRGIEADHPIRHVLAMVVRSHLEVEVETAENAAHSYGLCTPLVRYNRARWAAGTSHPWPTDSIEHALLLAAYDRGVSERTVGSFLSGLVQWKSWVSPNVAKAE